MSFYLATLRFDTSTSAACGNVSVLHTALWRHFVSIKLTRKVKAFRKKISWGTSLYIKRRTIACCLRRSHGKSLDVGGGGGGGGELIVLSCCW